MSFLCARWPTISAGTASSHFFVPSRKNGYAARAVSAEVMAIFEQALYTFIKNPLWKKGQFLLEFTYSTTKF